MEEIKTPPEEVKRKSKHEGLGTLIYFALVFIIILVVKTYILTPYIVDGASMYPTLHDRDRLIVNKAISEGSYKRGDIIIIKDEKKNKNYVKRIIGFPKDKLKMENDILTINGKPVHEDYLTSNKKDAEKQQYTYLTEDFEVEVPSDSYFVMGDNRQNSKDSRNGLGFIKKSDVIGKAEVIFFPLNDMRKAGSVDLYSE